MNSIQCPNPECRADNPANAKFCRNCGTQFTEQAKIIEEEKEEKTPSSPSIVDNRPFHLRFPKYNLIPYSQHPIRKEGFTWSWNRPDYVEKEYLPHKQDQFLWMVKDGKFGIIKYRYEDHWYGDQVLSHRIIKCKYDYIEKANGHFICHKGSQVTYIDLKGNILK